MLLHAEASYDKELDVMHLLVPLTPSGNEVMSWHRTHSFKLAKHRGDMIMAVRASVATAIGYVPAFRGEVWAEKVELSAVRCSDQRKMIDDDNLITGLKYARDALIAAGVVIDDNPKRVRIRPPIDDRALPKGADRREAWGGWYGPATHLIVWRVEKSKGRDNERSEDS